MQTTGASSRSTPNHARAVLSPDNLALIEAVARTGSMAAAARELGLVPSALTYRVRQVEDALDVLLFDRSARQARITPAGEELLRSGEHLLHELDAVAERVKRVATGWEPQLTIAADNIIARTTLFELCEAFFELGAPTRLRLRNETMTGTVEALLSGKADLALGVGTDASIGHPGIHMEKLGDLPFVFVVAPHHPLAPLPEPLADPLIGQHRAVAVADTTQRGSGMTIGILTGQEVFTVPTLRHKLEAQLRGMGCGFLPLPMVQPYIEAGMLVQKQVQRGTRVARLGYAWRGLSGHTARSAPVASQGKALQWWLGQLAHSQTRAALLNHHTMT